MKAIGRSYVEKVGDWPQLLPYNFWVDRTTHSFVTGFMSVELLYGQKLEMTIIFHPLKSQSHRG